MVGDVLSTRADLLEAIAIARAHYEDVVDATADFKRHPTEIAGRVLERAENRHRIARAKVDAVREALSEEDAA